MGAYILRRLLLIIPTLLGIMLINFTLVQFVPGGPVEQAIARAQGRATCSAALRAGAMRVWRGGGNDQPISAPAACRPNSSRSWSASSASTSRRSSGSFNMMWNYMRFDFGESYFRSISVIDLVSKRCRSRSRWGCGRR
jgi:microcin C transport system permease protein